MKYPADRCVPIATLEKKRGPYLPGKDREENTLSAVEKVMKGAQRATYFAEPGIRPGAAFYVHFPEPLNLSEFKVTTEKIPALAVKGLAMDGPQSDQSRRQEFEAWKQRLEAQKQAAKRQARWAEILEAAGRALQATIRLPSGETFEVDLTVTGTAKKKVTIDKVR